MEGTPLGLLVISGLVVLAAVWHYVSYRHFRHSPLWIAFSATSAAILFIWAGLAGYQLSKHSRFVAGTAWSETVIWWEVGVGLVAAALAAVCWRRGLKSISATTS